MQAAKQGPNAVAAEAQTQVGDAQGQDDVTSLLMTSLGSVARGSGSDSMEDETQSGKSTSDNTAKLAKNVSLDELVPIKDFVKASPSVLPIRLQQGYVHAAADLWPKAGSSANPTAETMIRCMCDCMRAAFPSMWICCLRQTK